MITAAQLRQRILEGRYRWGSATRSTGRYGAEFIRLRILPPDSSVVERRMARLTRFWPGIGIALIIVKLGIAHISPVIPYVVAFILGLGFVVCIGLVLGRASAPMRERSVELLGRVSFLSPKPTDEEHYDRVARFATELHDVEHDLNQGNIAWNQYHQAWSDVYTQARECADR